MFSGGGGDWNVLLSAISHLSVLPKFALPTPSFNIQLSFLPKVLQVLAHHRDQSY